MKGYKIEWARAEYENTEKRLQQIDGKDEADIRTGRIRTAICSLG